MIYICVKSMGVHFVRIRMKIDHVITAAHYIAPRNYVPLRDANTGVHFANVFAIVSQFRWKFSLTVTIPNYDAFIFFNMPWYLWA